MREGDGAQKQVVRITEWVADSRAGRRRVEWREEPVARVKEGEGEREYWGRLERRGVWDGILQRQRER